MAVKKSFVAIVLAACFLAVGPATAAAQGKIEFGFHYGPWSLNPIKGLIEGLAEDFAENMKDDMAEKFREENPDREIRERDFHNAVDFDSGGSNFGFEIRWYPAGENGSFSLGLAVEKSTFRIGPLDIETGITFEDVATAEQAQFDGRGTSEVTTKPLAALLSFRWDIFPSRPVHPYFSFGFGLAGGSALDETVVEYDFQGTASFPNEDPDVIEESGRKTLLQLREESLEPPEEGEEEKEPFEYPRVLPFFQVHFGLKAKITPQIHLLLDAGVFDGFLLRGGIAIRL